MRREAATLLALALSAASLSACSGADTQVPVCSRTDGSVFVIEAQSVPSATQLPCIVQFPLGWTLGGSLIQNGLFRFWLDSDRAGFRAAEVDLASTCDVSSAVAVPPQAGEAPARTYEEPISLPPGFASQRFLEFPGGCVTERFRFQGGAPATLALEVEQALSFVDRREIVDRVRSSLGLTLCGADAPPCAG